MTEPRCRRLRIVTVVAICAGLAAGAAAQGTAATDRAALEALYDVTGGPGWIENTNWRTSAPLGDWHGVSTDDDGRVRRLRLDSNALTGPLPGELGELTRLETLNLADNELSGPIPAGLGRLTQLRRLFLNGNALTGPIPAELGRLTRLRNLYLGRNNLTGRLPNDLGNLTNLIELRLARNRLTGSIPANLRRLTNLLRLDLGFNDLAAGPIPAWVADLAELEDLSLRQTNRTGSVPGELGRLSNLESLSLEFNWGLSGPLPPGLRLPRLKKLNIHVTQACAPPAWRSWLATLDFAGAALCGAGPNVTIDVAVVYTSAARGAAGGVAEVQAVIDLMIAETNQAYAASGVRHRLALVATEETAYTYSTTGRGSLDLRRLADPSDGYMDEVHPLRDRTGADLVHLIVEPDVGGAALEPIPSAFGLTCLRCGGIVFAHELGHNMGLVHDRYQVLHTDWEAGVVTSHPAYGYVNQLAFETGATQSKRWRTIMSYPTQCSDAKLDCEWLLRFSNPRRTWRGDPLGVPFESGSSGVTGPADAAAVINATGIAIAAWRDRPTGEANRPPVPAGTLPDRRLQRHGRLDLDLHEAFLDPDGDPLTWMVASTAPHVVTVSSVGAFMTRRSERWHRCNPRDRHRPWRPECDAVVHGHGHRDRAVHRRPHRARGDAGPGRPLHGAAVADRRPAGGNGSRAVRLDGTGPAAGGDAGPGRAPARAAGGAGRGICGGGAGGPGLGGRVAGVGVDPDPGAARDGASRRGVGAGVRSPRFPTPT